MKIGKKYKLKVDTIREFKNASVHNEDLIQKISYNGGQFEVLELVDDYGSVCSVVFPNGSIKRAYSGGGDYFEILPEEFKYFEEVTEEVVDNTEQHYMSLRVDETNWKEAIALIEKTFKN